MLNRNFPILAVCLIVFASLSWRVQAETQETPEQEPFIQEVKDLLSIFQAHDLVLDTAALRDVLIDTLIQTVDPQAKQWNEEKEAGLTARRAGQVFDVGIELTTTTNNVFQVAAIEEGSPVIDAGMELDDRILRIENTDAEDMSLHQAHSLLRHKDSRPVKLVFKKGVDNSVHTQAVHRVERTLPSIGPVEMLPSGIGLIRAHRINEAAGHQIAETLQSWTEKEIAGAVLDLRGADGDGLDAITSIGALFAPVDSFLFTYRTASEAQEYAKHTEHEAQVTMPVMVLIDGKTGGAAEVLAAVLRDSVRGVMLFGQPTRGDLLLREALALPDASLIYITTRKLVTGNNTVYTGSRSVQPDVLVGREEATPMTPPTRNRRTPTLDEESEQKQLQQRLRGDNTLRRAVDVLLGLKALNMRPHTGT